jgi:putative tryptophan/tyrosine transport system substrate-binding protein
MAAIRSAAASFGVEVNPIDVRNAKEMERAVIQFARGPNGGLIASTDPWTVVRRQLIVTLADRHGLRAVYPFRYFVTIGGLVSYGPDIVDQFRRAASYVDRILKGDNPSNLPVEQPTKLAIVINLKTAKALGLTIPPSLLATADEVIE